LANAVTTVCGARKYFVAPALAKKKKTETKELTTSVSFKIIFNV
jgi:hypothetical protein